MRKLLTDNEFQQTFSPSMQDITGREEVEDGVLDVAPYYGTIPTGDFGSHQPHEDFVDRVYRTSDNRFDHVLFMTRTQNVFMVVVVDLPNGQILGHHLLDLNSKYGLDAQNNSFNPDAPGRAG
jgi:hypothetical protein